MQCEHKAPLQKLNREDYMKNTFNDLKNNLSEQDIASILSIVGYRCRIKTCKRLYSIIKYGANSIPSYGIFERLTKNDSGQWDYCAGQSYPDEIKTMRECILKG